ncbi:uncharacterized protein [Palaemon carinicauda]|uniref:uncharacterized protein n=1 Tax=Palaemon carinicauda TaxID=392227 RepID=UPI0035B5ED4F
MAGMTPNTPGRGNKIPVSSYMAGISESYPNVNRQRLIESSINSKERVDFMPSNVGINQVLSDRYIEFRVNGVVGSFLDLSSITLELFIRITRNGVNLTAAQNVGVVNGVSNTLFKSVSVFLNEKMVESCPLYNYLSYMKMLMNVKPDSLENIARCGYFYDDYCKEHGITRQYTDDTSKEGECLEVKQMPKLKIYGINTYFPILLDLATIDMYLMDFVNLRIRLELANDSWVMNTDKEGHLNNLTIQQSKLWIDLVTPHYNAMAALNQSLLSKPIQYIFSKSLYKTYVVGINESSIMIDEPFGSCIPDKMTLALIDMRHFSGDYTRNPLFFHHANVNNIHITINGSTVYNINAAFPERVVQAYYESRKAIGIDDENIISLDSFTEGRTIFNFNFVHEDMEEALPVERSASMRIILKLTTAVTTPHLIMLFGDTTGILSIDADRIIHCDVRG